MDASHGTPGEGAGGARWEAAINWLALLMLLAGSVLWPR